ncbi:hypothetical protein DC498_11835 [Terrimonas sp.]|uniref:hypothetical protein n=1 Tax=Terrimonas sp. TaxID=1914338 RepID=UPI000D51EA65|nr:hypothetical protein [Terrimonas sp.]PVD52071.1 hypothetical protein DC498_11835 [Terrimonas sp.]
MRLTTENFEIVSGGNIYTVKATEYINGSEELRYRVSFNDNPICVFGWNNELNRFAVMHDKRNPDMSNEIETAIGKRLEKIQQMKEAA